MQRDLEKENNSGKFMKKWEKVKRLREVDERIIEWNLKCLCKKKMRISDEENGEVWSTWMQRDMGGEDNSGKFMKRWEETKILWDVDEITTE